MHTIPLRKALAACSRFGASVQPKRRTGEMRIIFPNGDRVTLNARKKETPRELMKHLHRRGIV